MKAMVKDLLKSVVISIGLSLAIFCVIGIVFDIGNQGTFSLEGYQFTKMVMGCLIVGLGFGVPSVVYSNDKMPMPIKVLIHMGIGCVIYTAVASAVGWIDISASLAKVILMLGIQLAVAFLIWLGFMIYYRKEANILNRRIQELKKS